MDSFDELRIDTPEQIALEMPLAGVGSRFLALAVDSVIQFGMYLIATLIFAFGLPRVSLSLAVVPASLGPGLAVFVIFGVYWGYFAIFETLWKGQTPGKRFACIRVIKESGRPINAFEAIGRNLMRAVDGLPGFYGIGLVTMMCNRQSRRLGDFVAGTVVVHEQTTSDARPAWNTAEAGLVATADLKEFAPEELVLIETYLNRRWETTKFVRWETANQLVNRVKAKTGLQPQPNQDPDEFLEEAAKAMRDGMRSH